MRLIFIAAMFGVSAAASAHHSYAVFDMSKRLSINGTMAKVEWTNPHMAIWLYVPKKDGQSGYDLYAFESSGVNMMMRHGWTKSSLPAGEKVTVEYYPLKDGRNGGVFLKATHADGRVTTAPNLAEGVVLDGGAQR